MKLPKLWRKKRGGRFVGSYHATLDGEDVNLRTSDAQQATERLRDAVKKGRRNFVDEVAVAADLENAQDLPQTQQEASPATDLDEGPEINPMPPPAAPPPSPAPPPPLAPELAPAHDAASEAEVMAAAAADVAAAAAANDNGTPPEAPPQVDMAVLDSMLETGASVIVDLQLGLQAYAIKRGTGRIAGQIPADSELRKGAAQAWAQQLKVWFPATQQLPPWAIAVVLPLMAIPTQLATSREMTEEEKKAEEEKAHPPTEAVA